MSGKCGPSSAVNKKGINSKPRKTDSTDSNNELENLVNIPQLDYLEGEYKVEVNKITQILKEANDKIRFVLCLALLFDENYDTLSNLIDRKELDIFKNLIKNKFKFYDSDMESEIQERKTIIDCQNIEEFQEFLNNYESKFKGVDNTYEELNLIIEHFYKKDNIRMLCDEIIFKELPSVSLDFIIAIELFFKIIIDRMEMTPQNERAKECGLSKMYQDTFQLINDIEQLKTDIAPFVEEKDDTINANQNELDELENDRMNLTKKYKETILKNKLKFNQKMDWEWKAHELNFEKELELIRDKQKTFETLLSTNVENEKVDRIIKIKQDKQLLHLIEKYNTEKTEKDNLYEELLEKWRILTDELADTEKKFAKQDEIYLNLQLEKNQYDKEVWDKKLYNIQCKIAARKIQRYFRVYLKVLSKLEMQLFPKKGKGKMKGMKGGLRK